MVRFNFAAACPAVTSPPLPLTPFCCPYTLQETTSLTAPIARVKEDSALPLRLEGAQSAEEYLGGWADLCVEVNFGGKREHSNPAFLKFPNFVVEY